MLTRRIPPDKTTFPTDFSRFIVVEFQLDTVKMSRLPGSFVCNKKGTDNSPVTMPGAGIDGPKNPQGEGTMVVHRVQLRI